MSIRDTQFQGFAKALLREIHDPITDYWREDCQEVIACRAYDLVKHVLKDIRYDDEKYIDDHMGKLSDLTELPKDEQRGI